jgi:phosphoribosylglycinamide formyltransferase 1
MYNLLRLLMTWKCNLTTHIFTKEGAMATPKRLLMLASGGGTTAEHVWNAYTAGSLDVEPVGLIVNKTDTPVRERLLKAGMPEDRITSVNPRWFPSRKAFGEALLAQCEEWDIDIIGQYGWLVKTPKNVITAFDGGKRMINQHPGPVPYFGGTGMYGIRVHASVLYFSRIIEKLGKREVKYTCVISQRVSPEYDQGALLNYRCVPIRASDTPARLQKRALPIEWEVQIETLQRFADGLTAVLYYAAPFVYEDEIEPLYAARRQAKQNYP